MFITLIIGIIIVSVIVTFSALSISSLGDHSHSYEKKHQTSLPLSRQFSFEASEELLREEKDEDQE